MESVDWWADGSEGGEEGAWCTKTSSGRYSTNAVTVLTTWEMTTGGEMGLAGKSRETYLHETVCRVPVIEIHHSKLFAVLQLLYLHGEKSDCSLLVSFVGGIELVWRGIDVYWGNWGRQKVKEVAKWDAEGETVPQLCYGIS